MLNIFWANTVKFFYHVLDACQNLGDNSAKDTVPLIAPLLTSNGINYKSDHASF